jgi:hypothetical protein
MLNAIKEQQALIRVQHKQILSQKKQSQLQQEQIAAQRAQLNIWREKQTHQTHTLEAVAAQISLLQNKLTQLEGNANDPMPAMKTAPPNARRHKVKLAAATDGSSAFSN